MYVRRLVASLCLSLACCVTARAALPPGIAFDDGFAYVECRNFDVVEDNKPIARWVPVANLRILGNVPDRSGFRMVVKKDGKKLAEYTNDAYPQRLGGTLVGACIVGWWKQTPQLDVDGPIDLEVYYIDGKTDESHLAKTLKLDVRRVATERGFVGQRDPGPSYFYVNRHGEVLSTILYFRPPSWPSYTGIENVGTHADAMLELIMNYSENQDFARPRVGRIKVEVDGKPVEMKVPGNDFPKDEMSGGSVAGQYNVAHSDRAAEKYFKSGPAYKEYIGFSRRSFVMPLQFGPKPPGRPQSQVFASDHPGNWKVTWLIDRKPVRIYRFTIDKDGRPVPHAEQAAGLNLLDGAILVDTEIPADGGEFDGRLTNEFVKQSGFLGRPWATDAMKAAAEQVPAKGTPFPVPSDKQ
jgi:hypothetical protein